MKHSGPDWCYVCGSRERETVTFRTSATPEPHYVRMCDLCVERACNLTENVNLDRSCINDNLLKAEEHLLIAAKGMYAKDVDRVNKIVRKIRKFKEV